MKFLVLYTIKRTIFILEMCFYLSGHISSIYIYVYQLSCQCIYIKLNFNLHLVLITCDHYCFRHSLKYQYSALDSGNGTTERSPRERAARDRALGACQEWLKTLSGRYEIIAHLDDIGSRNNKNWFLLSDSTVIIPSLFLNNRMNLNSRMELNI